MRGVAVFWVVLLLGLASGCSSRQEAQPLFTGKLESGTFWKHPLSATSNEGGDYAKGSRVEVYDQFVIITTPDGLSHVHPHGYYSGLTIKRD